MGDVYGGGNWMDMSSQLAQALAAQIYQRLMLQLQQQQSLGYVQPNALGMAPTREQALMGTWNARKDIRDMYTQWWGADANPIQAMENWLSITTEEGAKADPIAFATQAGYIEPYNPGTPQKTLEREMGEGNLGMQYLNLLASQKGPSDWIKYWNTTRNAEATNLPAWANALTGGLNLPGFQGAGTGGGGGGQPVTQAMTGGAAIPSWAQGLNISPISIKPQQFVNMLPSERAGLQGLVEAQGGHYPDYLQQMQNAWPVGHAKPLTHWG